MYTGPLFFSYNIIFTPLNLFMEEKKHSFLFGASKFISDLFNPLVSLCLFFVYTSIRLYSFEDALMHFLPLLLLIILPVVIWITWNVKTGRYTNMDVSNRVQRFSLYFFITASVLVYMVFKYIRNGQVDLVVLFILILLLTMQISNYYIKSSMHTAFNVFVAALYFATDLGWGMAWSGIAALVGLTRVIVGRHTSKEVFMGAGIAVVVSFLYLYCRIQFQS